MSALLVAIVCSLTYTRAAYANSLDGSFKKIFSGIASWYGGRFQGRRTASGSTYNMNQMTCAHKTLPFGTKLIVKNQTNGKTCQVTVTDRGPYYGARVLDLSKAAADKLGVGGIEHVVCYIGKAVSKGIGGTAKGIAGTAKGIEDTAKGTGQKIASLPGTFQKMARELSQSHRQLPEDDIAISAKPMSKQAFRKEIEHYYAHRALSFETPEVPSWQMKGSLEPRAKTACLLVPHRGASDNNAAAKSVLAALEQDIF